jgi:hypothetical protein
MCEAFICGLQIRHTNYVGKLAMFAHPAYKYSPVTLDDGALLKEREDAAPAARLRLSSAPHASSPAWRPSLLRLLVSESEQLFRSPSSRTCLAWILIQFFTQIVGGSVMVLWWWHPPRLLCWCCRRPPELLSTSSMTCCITASPLWKFHLNL